MSHYNALLLVKLLTAHMLTDFVFQPTSWVAHKKAHRHRSPYLYYHVLIAAACSYLLLMQWFNWYIPLAILVTHYLIDLWKLRQKDTFAYFLADQGLHILVILVIWMMAGPGREQLLQLAMAHAGNPKKWLVAAGFVFVIWPAQYILMYATKQWSSSFDAADASALKNAGKWIGIFERILILVFVLTAHYDAIGFLIAAKSFIRFSESGRKTRAQTEYILIGTLISFTIAIVVGTLINILLTGT